jgi:uncharacterized membrane protein YsdA (DUF1294 family)
MNPPRSSPASRPVRVRFDASTFLVLCALLAIPSYALSRFTARIDWRVLFGVPFALSVFAFFAYRGDKRSAEAGEWRVPESTLHFMSLIGGWPGAFLAQRAFRHKTAKLSFQFVFWVVVLVHEFAAVDSLLDWRLTKEAIRAIKP